MLSQEQKDLLASLSANYKTGRSLSSSNGNVNEHESHRCEELNIINPPLNCPKWACIILPCINHIPSMKLFKSIVPREAEVRIGSRWVCYDASSLNRGDIIRLSEGDTVPADARLLSLGPDFVDDDGDEEEEQDGDGFDQDEEATLELVVDSNHITGETKPRIISLNPDNKTVNAVELFAGSVVLHGEAIAVVTKIGGRCVIV
jgi:Cation transport ATPase